MQEYVVNSWLTVYTHIVHHNTPLQQMIRKITAIALRGDDVGTQRKWLIKRKPLNADSVVLVQVYLVVKVFC